VPRALERTPRQPGARRDTTRTLDELVLPEDTMAQLREICVHVRQRPARAARVGLRPAVDRWAKDYTPVRRPSGTGKTLAAEVIGGSSDSISCASISPRWSANTSARTEKNLDRIFRVRRAATSSSSSTKPTRCLAAAPKSRIAHDRYANIEVDFLLQRLEQYEGVVVLASNLAQNIDESFTRRMQFTIDFPFRTNPCVWRSGATTSRPRRRSNATSIFLHGARFKIAGGNIRKIVLNAAFLAADDGGALG
jgi:hypothetical protein